MKKFAILVAFALAACSSLAAKDYWYVCLGSFKKQANADNYVQYLKKEDVQACIFDVIVSGTLMHRVVQSKPFETFALANDSRKKLQKEQFFQTLGINDLWVCRGQIAEKTAGKGQFFPCTPIDADVSHKLALEPTSPRPAPFRTAPTWDNKAEGAPKTVQGDRPLDEDLKIHRMPNGDITIESDKGFNGITMSRR